MLLKSGDATEPSVTLMYKGDNSTYSKKERNGKKMEKQERSCFQKTAVREDSEPNKKSGVT